MENNAPDSPENLQPKDSEKNSEEAFPIWAFPTELQNIIKAYNKCLNYPIDFSGVSMLCAVSVAIGNSCEIKIKEGRKDTAILHIALVGPSGTAKSHPLSTFLDPIIQNDNESYLRYKRQKAEYDNYLSIKKDQRNDQEKKEVPFYRCMLVSDITPEAIAIKHLHNERGIMLYNDELPAMYKNINRYNRGSGAEAIMSAWSGKPLSIDRKTDEPVRIMKPFISICGTIQTAILSELGKDNRNENGFIYRFLFSMPEGLKIEKWSTEEINPAHITNWKTIIDRILSIPYNGEPRVYQLSEKANEALLLWHETHRKAVNRMNDGHQRGVNVKLEIYLFRIALLLHILENVSKEKDDQYISATTFYRAIHLIEYFRVMGEKAQAYINNSNNNMNKKNVIRYLHSLGNSENKIASVLMVSQQYVNQILNQ